VLRRVHGCGLIRAEQSLCAAVYSASEVPYAGSLVLGLLRGIRRFPRQLNYRCLLGIGTGAGQGSSVRGVGIAQVERRRRGISAPSLNNHRWLWGIQWRTR
jgi:hypothetical protein